MMVERRMNRSDNVHEALTLQLAASMTRAKFDAVVLAEDQGFAIAGVGTLSESEEVAALAPGLVSGKGLWQGTISLNDGPQKMVTIAPVVTAAGSLYLCGVEGESGKRISELCCTSIGVNRILL